MPPGSLERYQDVWGWDGFFIIEENKTVGVENVDIDKCSGEDEECFDLSGLTIASDDDIPEGTVYVKRVNGNAVKMVK